jgi:hypothetical protein
VTRTALHHRPAKDVVNERVLAVIDRLDVAMQFSTVDTYVASQVIHAVNFAWRGPTRADDDYLKIETADAIALVHALLPFIRAARNRPGCEGCAKCLPDQFGTKSRETDQ